MAALIVNFLFSLLDPLDRVLQLVATTAAQSYLLGEAIPFGRFFSWARWSEAAG